MAEQKPDNNRVFDICDDIIFTYSFGKISLYVNLHLSFGAL